MHVILPPNTLPLTEKKYTVFLAGSIDMGNAARWQDRVIELLRDFDITILNPRREHWDLSIPQRANDPEFRAQVEWELHGLEGADLIIMYFDRDSKSPISFLEMGLFAKSHKMIVFCPDGFWRKGNIDVECEEFNIPHFSDEEKFFSEIRKTVREKSILTTTTI